MIAKRQHPELIPQVYPGLLQFVTRLAKTKTSGVHLEHLQTPSQARPESQRSIVIEPAAIQIGRGHARRNGDEPFRLRCGGQELRHALIGKAVHTDTAIRFRTLAQPLDGSSSVVALITKWIKRSFRIASSAHILNDHVVTVARKPHRMRVHNRGRYVATIGLAIRKERF